MGNQFQREPSSSEGGSSVFLKCKNQALVYLSQREHNKKELSGKLQAKGYDISVIKAVLELLESDGLLSESRYIRIFVSSSNRRHPEGRKLLEKRLLSKGADRDTAKSVLDDIYTEQYTADLVSRAKDIIVGKGKAKTEADIRFCLQKAGFSISDIKLLKND